MDVCHPASGHFYLKDVIERELFSMWRSNAVRELDVCHARRESAFQAGHSAAKRVDPNKLEAVKAAIEL